MGRVVRFSFVGLKVGRRLIGLLVTFGRFGSVAVRPLTNLGLDILSQFGQAFRNVPTVPHVFDAHFQRENVVEDGGNDYSVHPYYGGRGFPQLIGTNFRGEPTASAMVTITRPSTG